MQLFKAIFRVGRLLEVRTVMQSDLLTYRALHNEYKLKKYEEVSGYESARAISKGKAILFRERKGFIGET